MRFSIVIPVRNGENYLASALGSALSQTRPADEIIVSDNGSTDSTRAIATSDEFSSRIKYFHVDSIPNFVDSWNKAISFASGEFVTVLHHDDLLDNDYLANIESAIEKHPKVLHLFSACRYINEKGEIVRSPETTNISAPVLLSGEEYARRYLHGAISGNHIHRCPGVTTSRRLLLTRCTYRREAGHIADDDFFLRVGAHTDVIGIPRPLASYRHHPESTTNINKLLALRLAKDLLFQARYHAKGHSLLDDDDRRALYAHAARQINMSLLAGLKNKDMEWIGSTAQLKGEFDRLVPDFFSKSSPAWARLMWQLASLPDSLGFIPQKYVRALGLLAAMRNFLRRAPNRG